MLIKSVAPGLTAIFQLVVTTEIASALGCGMTPRVCWHVSSIAAFALPVGTHSPGEANDFPWFYLVLKLLKAAPVWKFPIRVYGHQLGINLWRGGAS